VISFAIMAHPKRSEWVKLLSTQTGIKTIVWDTDNNIWDTGKRSLLAFDSGAEYHVVIQDDCIPCDNFVAVCNAAIPHAKGNPIGLYVGYPKPYRNAIQSIMLTAIANGYSWIEMQPCLWGQCMSIPTKDIAAIVEWGECHPIPNRYDQRVSEYYLSKNQNAWFTIPSLVDHRRQSENPSLTPNHGDDRYAYHWERCPVADWSKPPLQVFQEFMIPFGSSGNRIRTIVGNL